MVVSEGYTTYSWSFYGEYSKDISYDVTPVDNTQTYFKPINLNRNGVATADDYQSYYPILASQENAQALNITVDNRQGITDGVTGVPMLDINQKQSWTLQFNTAGFGLPNSFASVTNPYKSYIDTGSGGYKTTIFNQAGKNRITSGTLQTDTLSTSLSGYSTDPFRYGMNLSATFPGAVVSIQLNDGPEVLNSCSLDFGASSGTDVNTITVRSIKVGTYRLGNAYDDNPFWELTYQQTKVRSYGIEYSGTINGGGIEDPTVLSNDFYAASSTRTFFQPILCGRFDVKTVGGSVK